MATPKGEVSFEVDGERFTLLYDVNTLCQVEDMLGLETIADLDLGKQMSIRQLRAVFCCGLQRHHPGVTEVGAGDLLSKLGMDGALGKVMEALIAAFPEATDAAVPQLAGRGLGTGSRSSKRGASSAPTRKPSGSKPRAS